MKSRELIAVDPNSPNTYRFVSDKGVKKANKKQRFKHLKNHKLLVLFIVLIVVSALISATNVFRNLNLPQQEYYMAAPKLNSKHKVVKKAIESYIGEGFRWKFPTGGDWHFGVSKICVSEDKTSYAVALCQSKYEFDRIHALILVPKGSEWNVTGDMVINSDSIEKTLVQDINKDGKNEFLVYYKTKKGNDYIQEVRAFKSNGITAEEIRVPNEYKNI